MTRPVAEQLAILEIEKFSHLGELKITNTEEHKWGWVVSYGLVNGGSIIGGGPILINRVTWATKSTGSGSHLPYEYKRQEREAGLRPWWKFW